VERRADPVLDRNFTVISDFQDHIRLLQLFGILSLHDLAEELSSPKQRPRTAAVLTFDDGYANNVIAAEILSAAGIPWSIFVTSGVVGRGSTTWPEELSLLLLCGEARQVRAFEKTWPLVRREEREIAFRNILVAMKSLPAVSRRETLGNIREQFHAKETERLLQNHSSLKMLSWEELQQLSSSGVEVCSHGVHHEIHHQDQPAEIRNEELRASKAELETRLGRPCDFFAFPNGDFNSNSAAEVEAAGFRLGFTTKHDTITRGANSFLLPRFDPNNYVSPEYFTRNFFWQDGGLSRE
jgi:peptidoglycan/xylan/chitin deacetylase (PgdA/CDA1 family)